MKPVAHRVVLTGATGMLGSHVLERLSAQPDTEVLVLVRDGARIVPRGGVTVARVSFNDEGRLIELILKFKPTAVVHAAASGLEYAHGDWVSVFDFNVLGAARLVRAACLADGAHFVYVSTGLAYREQGRPLCEEDPLDAAPTYGASKAAADIVVRSGALELGLPATVLRPFSFTGVGDHTGRLFPTILDAAAAGRRAPLSSGEQQRDYCAVSDVAGAVLAALERPPAGGGPPVVLNLGSGRAATLRTLVEEVVQELDIPVELGFGDRENSPGPQSLVANVDAAARALNWRAATPIAQAVWALARARHPTMPLKPPRERT